MKTHRVTTVIIFFSLCISVLPLPQPAWAHRVNIFAWVEGDTVYVETKFPGGKKVKAGHIVVLDVQGNDLLSGVTNDMGEFSFKIPKREDLKIVLLAGEGHRAEWTLLASEMEEWPKKMGSSELTS